MEITQTLIPRVKSGSQGLEVSKLGYGCMSLSGVCNSPVDDENGISVILHTFNRGITFFDTSDAYGPHANKILVVKALRRLPRERVQLAIKFAVAGASPSGLLVNVHRSMRGLAVEQVVLSDSLGQLKKLVEEGMGKYIGLSEASSGTIRRAHAVHPISAVQMEWSLWSRDIEEEIVYLCRFSGDNLKKNKVLYARLANIAVKHRCKPSQLALAWILHQGNIVSPIPGTTKIKHLDDNINTLLVELTEENMKDISSAVSVEEVAGDRLYGHLVPHSWKFANTPAKESYVFA